MDAVARYQVLLDRAAAARLSKEKEGIRKKTQTQPFDSYIDPDGKQEENSDPESEDEEQGKEPEGDTGESGGFGKHYA
jgi:hypothetical protein